MFTQKVIGKTQNYIPSQLKKKNEEEESSKQISTESEGSSNSNLSRSKGLQYVENIQNGTQAPKSAVKFPVAAAYSQVNRNINIHRQNIPHNNMVVNNGLTTPVNIHHVRPQQQIQTQQVSAVAPTETPVRSPKINIAQVIGDFRNTARAIGTPDDLLEEVNGYLSLVDTQVRKDSPNVKLVQTNLKNAAGLLDGFISETLNKDSKVVNNWIEAVFLQQVDYKYNENDINEAFLVRMPSDNKTEGVDGTSEAQQTQATTSVETQVKAPVVNIDIVVKDLFAQGKELAKNGDDQEALDFYRLAMQRSKEVDDKESQSKLYFEAAKIYDKYDNISQAIKTYQKASDLTENPNLKIQSYFAIGKIYDETRQFTPAIETYMTAASVAGESDNLKAQTKSLTKIANILADTYNQDAFDVYAEAKIYADATNDLKVKAYVSSNTGDAYSKFNRPAKALKYYSNAIKDYENANAPVKVAINYKKAAELMQDCNNSDKAKRLFQKAITYATKSNKNDLVTKLSKELASIK